MSMNLFSPRNFIMDNLSAKTYGYNTESISFDTVIDSNKVSYFVEALEYLKEQNKEWSNARQVINNCAITDYGNQVVIKEAFEAYFEGMILSLTNSIDYMTTMINKMEIDINIIAKSDTRLINSLSSIKSFIRQNTSYVGHTIPVCGYDFRFPANVPSTSPLDDLMGQLGVLDKVSFSRNHSSIKAAVEDYLDEQNSTVDEHFVDIIRGNILDVDYDIPESEFAKECFDVYRSNNSGNKEPLTLTSDLVSGAATRLMYVSKIMPLVKADLKKYGDKIKQTIGVINGVIKKINSGETANKFLSAYIKANGKPTKDSEDDIAVMDCVIDGLESFIRSRVDVVQTFVNNYLIAYSAKLDAIRESFAQDKNILTYALGLLDKKDDSVISNPDDSSHLSTKLSPEKTLNDNEINNLSDDDIRNLLYDTGDDPTDDVLRSFKYKNRDKVDKEDK